MRSFIIIVFAVFVYSSLTGQQIPLSKEYMVNGYAISPAFAGIHGGFEAFFQARKNMLGQVNAPEINKLSVNGSVFDRVGLGLNLLDYKRGIFRTTRFETGYSYQILIAEEHIVSFGLSAMILHNRVSLASIDELGYDPYITFDPDFSSIQVNFGTGLAYLYKGLRIGVHAPLLLENNIKDNDSDVYRTSRSFGLHAGYVIRYNSLTFYPVLSTDHFSGNTYWEGSILCSFRNTLWVGASTGSNRSAGFCLGGAPFDNLIINYTYELSGNIAKAAYAGSHELNVGILINKKRRYKDKATSMFKAYRTQPYHLL